MKNLRNIFIMLTINLFTINSFAQSDLAGAWMVGGQNTIVKIEQQNDIYSGRIISSDNPKVKIGRLMVKDLKQTKGKWEGKVYSPKQKEWYDAEFTKKENKLNIEISVGFFSKTVEWTKHNS
ncbi:MAG: DUF2147 domain-containing protein [Bacteroidetes bacterium]|jgi:uncharacterized protein (DUF2147 family)|nr:DUF2147 domain-containing protein [Bacteroidota bacterium]MBT5527740.1 DUF2147 domain-containing protein [Cytophagia bacterium]MBT3424826.1 DUF2147 domain-containing protein [Bacteroidota bacterium]MBT3801572.1 DUF2147 domain-containing protein [Bacteroidota bacterium]MBT3934119.1 DUF2147 domain-containing protein [Bacteroidota bacterium]